ncbi:MAG TPA: hypothetical protein V6C97_02585 [Oculatellaceae cyanobacterium]
MLAATGTALRACVSCVRVCMFAPGGLRVFTFAFWHVSLSLCVLCVYACMCVCECVLMCVHVCVCVCV